MPDRLALVLSDEWRMAYEDGAPVLVGPAHEAHEAFPDGLPAGATFAYVAAGGAAVLIVRDIVVERRGGLASLTVPHGVPGPGRWERHPVSLRVRPAPRPDRNREPPRRPSPVYDVRRVDGPAPRGAWERGPLRATKVAEPDGRPVGVRRRRPPPPERQRQLAALIRFVRDDMVRRLTNGR